MGRFKDAGAVPVGSGEGAFQCTEEFAFEKSRSNRPTIDSHERLLFTAAVLVDHAGEDLFARAGLAFNQNRRVGGGDLEDVLADVDHFLRSGDRGRFRKVLHVGGSFFVLAVEFRFRFLDHGQQIVEFEGLGEVLDGSTGNARADGFHAAAAAHEDDGAFGIFSARRL